MDSKENELQRAELWSKERNNRARCFLCHHRCLIHDGRRGLCGVRENRSGVLYSLNYGKLISANKDPIEKKPLFHFYPGTMSFSIATVGCNLRCLNCQNAAISQWPVNNPGKDLPGDYFSPEEIADLARSQRCATISYTYTEPTIFLEYARDVAIAAESADLKNIFVTNGYMTEEALDFMGGYLHAANVDIKSADESVMKKLTGAHAQPVLDNIRMMHSRGIWIEATTLVIPGYNDTEGALLDIARFLAETSRDIPWHVSRFHASYKLPHVRSTPASVLKRAYEIGKNVGIRHVYTGNLWGDENESTCCHSCGKTIIRRYGFSIRDMYIKNGKCTHCGETIAGRGLP